jgi:multidrug efflux pump subunit AcrB
LLTGAAKYLFTPLAMAVVFALMASYLLSRTLIPNMVHYLLKKEIDLYREGEGGEPKEAPGWNWRIHHWFNRKFDKMRDHYAGLLDWMIDHYRPALILFGAFVALSLCLVFFIGEDFFPTVDSGQIRLHMQTPSGTRIEEAEQYFARAEREIRTIIPAEELDIVLDNIGLPNSGINLAFSVNPVIGNGDGEILIALQKKHGLSAKYSEVLRTRLRSKFPDCKFFFEAANITNQILNFGLPAPIDLQVTGNDAAKGFELAKKLEKEISTVPGAVDVHVHQVTDYPEIQVNVDRSKANNVGLTERDVSNSLLISLSSSGQAAPNEWLNYANGVNYQVAVQTPQFMVNSFEALLRTPISGAAPPQAASQSNANIGASPSQSTAGYGNPGSASSQTQLLSNLASLQRGVSTQIVNHYDVQPVFDVYANVDRRDLGGVRKDVEKIIEKMTAQLPKATTLELRGQVKTMTDSFLRLGIGIVFAIFLVYLLMVVNFQSWIDPLIILMALPGAFAGVLWMLFVTQTTLSVPSLMGSIMSIGVATANSILVVVFANDERAAGKDARAAAHSAGVTRLRPVCMTALAMLLGMLPMSLAVGEGGEQNAPLGRAVIGGLLIATISTLFIVPVMYTLLRKDAPIDYDKPHRGRRA